MPEPKASEVATPIECVVFDIDDTLYLERDYVRSGFQAVARWVREELGVNSFFEETWKCFETGCRGDTFNIALQNLGIVPSQELVKTLVSVYRSHEPTISLLPDSEGCLRTVCGKAFVGIISDGAVAGQERKVQRLGLSSQCNHIILTESFGVEYSKPHPHAFEEMQKIAKCAPSACIYIADNPAKDFIAPNRLGWRTIRVRRPGGLHCTVNCAEGSHASIELTDLIRLPNLLGLS